MQRKQHVLVLLGVLMVVAISVAAHAENPKRSKSKPANTQVKPTDKPFLWKIEGEKTSYLYGTTHAGDARVATVPQVVKDAVRSCDAVYTERPLDDVAEQEMIQATMGKTEKALKDVVPDELYQRVNKYFVAQGAPEGGMNRVQIWVLYKMVDEIDVSQGKDADAGAQAREVPLDAIIYSNAQRMGKKVGGLMTTKEHLDVFTGLSQEQQIALLDHELKKHEDFTPGPDFKEPVEESVQLYLAGDLEAIYERGQAEFDLTSEIDKMFYKRIVTDRDIEMAKRIAKHLTDNPDTSCFFAIGVLHLAGDSSVLKLLRDKGFKITRVTVPEARSRKSAK